MLEFLLAAGHDLAVIEFVEMYQEESVKGRRKNY